MYLIYLCYFCLSVCMNVCIVGVRHFSNRLNNFCFSCRLNNALAESGVNHFLCTLSQCSSFFIVCQFVYSFTIHLHKAIILSVLRKTVRKSDLLYPLQLVQVWSLKCFFKCHLTIEWLNKHILMRTFKPDMLINIIERLF